MNVEDFFQQGKRWWFRLHEKGGKRHEVPAHHNADAYLHAYIEAAGIADQKKSPLFRSAAGKTQKLTEAAGLQAKLMGEEFRMRQESMAVLTPEQKTQLEQRRAEFKAKREQFKARRGEQQTQQQ